MGRCLTRHPGWSSRLRSESGRQKANCSTSRRCDPSRNVNFGDEGESCRTLKRTLQLPNRVCGLGPLLQQGNADAEVNQRTRSARDVGFRQKRERESHGLMPWFQNRSIAPQERLYFFSPFRSNAEQKRRVSCYFQADPFQEHTAWQSAHAQLN